MPLVFKKYSFAEVTYQQIRFNKTTSFLETQGRLIEMVYMSKTHTKRKITFERVSKDENKWYPSFFKNNPPILPTHPFFGEKSEPSFYGKLGKLWKEYVQNTDAISCTNYILFWSILNKG